MRRDSIQKQMLANVFTKLQKGKPVPCDTYRRLREMRGKVFLKGCRMMARRSAREPGEKDHVARARGTERAPNRQASEQKPLLSLESFPHNKILRSHSQNAMYLTKVERMIS